MADQAPVDIDLDQEWRNAVAEYAKECDYRLDQRRPEPDQVVAMIRRRREADEKHSPKLKKFEGYIEETMKCLLTVAGALSSVASMVGASL